VRDLQRIPKVLKALERLWEKYPDQRLGQLVANVVSFEGTGDTQFSKIFNTEDDKLIELINKEFISVLQERVKRLAALRTDLRALKYEGKAAPADEVRLKQIEHELQACESELADIEVETPISQAIDDLTVQLLNKKGNKDV